MSSVNERISYEDFGKLVPAARAAILSITKATAESGLEKDLLELVKLRASQINGCAFCLQLHLNDARRIGMPAAKLDLVSVWHEVGIFSERERAALAWTEALTRLETHGVSDADFAAARAHFDERELAFLSVAIGTINLWNRLGVSLRFAPPIPSAAAAS